jgi:hypothetical protein
MAGTPWFCGGSGLLAEGWVTGLEPATFRATV